jgi:inorganic pyrophosphatase
MGRPVRVLIEVPRGSFLKRGEGGVEFVSPVPCPFNYGSVPGTLADDGDEADALVLGDALPLGAVAETMAWLRVRFEDDGSTDDKLICGPHPPSARELAGIRRFFAVYAVARTALNRARGRGNARYLGVAPLLPDAVG